MVELQVPETLESKTMANSIYYKHLTDEHSRKSCWLPTMSYLLPPFKCLLWFFPAAFTHRTVFLRQDARPVNLNDSDIKANKQNEGKPNQFRWDPASETLTSWKENKTFTISQAVWRNLQKRICVDNMQMAEHQQGVKAVSIGVRATAVAEPNGQNVIQFNG